MRLGPALAIWILVVHAVTWIHECVGHGLFAWMWGAEVSEIYVRIFGTAGFVRWSGTLSSAQTLWVGAGGILSTAVAAVLLSTIRKTRRPRNPYVDFLQWALICAWSMSSFGYLILGLYFGYGDPRPFALWLKTAGALHIIVGAMYLMQLFVVDRLGRNLVGVLDRWGTFADSPNAFIILRRLLRQYVLPLGLVFGLGICEGKIVQSLQRTSGQTMARVMKAQWQIDLEKRISVRRIELRDAGLDPVQLEEQLLLEQRELRDELKPSSWFYGFYFISLVAVFVRRISVTVKSLHHGNAGTDVRAAVPPWIYVAAGVGPFFALFFQ